MYVEHMETFFLTWLSPYSIRSVESNGLYINSNQLVIRIKWYAQITFLKKEALHIILADL